LTDKAVARLLLPVEVKDALSDSFGLGDSLVAQPLAWAHESFVLELLVRLVFDYPALSEFAHSVVEAGERLISTDLCRRDVERRMTAARGEETRLNRRETWNLCDYGRGF